MTKEEKYNFLYMDIAIRVSEMSFCERKKVGSILVKDGRIISMGWNGMPTGFNNICEINNITLPEVIHSEANSLMKLVNSPETSLDSVMYTTTAPCMSCAKLIHQAMIKKIYYIDTYTSLDGLHFLGQCGVETLQLHY